MSTVVIYHQNCYDGFGAAWAAHRALKTEAKYVPMLYGDPVPNLDGCTTLFMIDVTAPRAELEKLRARFGPGNFLVLDHHQSAEKDLKGFDCAVFDMNHSGAYLAWTHFHASPVPEFVSYLEDRDLWRFKLPKSQEVAAALRAYPMDLKVWDGIAFDVEKLKGEGETCLRLTDSLVNQMCAQFMWFTIDGHKVPVANATVAFSEVGNRLLELHPEAPFAAYYFDRGDGCRQWGLRSRNHENVDVSVVAKKYGGGGHIHASGFTQRIGQIREF